MDVVVFVLKGADQHLLEEDLVQKTLLSRGGFGVGGVAVRGETKCSVEESVLLHVVTLEGLKAALYLRETAMGVKANQITVKRMKTKWGSCNPGSRNTWFNPELAKKNPRSLEYLVVHELAHLLERSHNEKFVAIMDRYLPDWTARRDELNKAPLAAEDWGDLENV
ncbi:M48 metallopeptidase family protein [Corynebacterium qintianiae]|uniref:M48 metallopeptidase family protein n=1 Tax=Corynebacterium qintianiae TaxID=2709392 RepID=UPI002017B13A|nr:M48 family metallopeptidase [Corynebacterium qintianiae]